MTDKPTSTRISTPVVNIGSASLLVIFLILSLVIFSVLTLTSANSDYKFSERAASRNTDYYAACALAEKTWDELDAAAAEGAFSGRDTVSYTVPIDSTQELSVVLTYVSDVDDIHGSGHYEVTQWKTVNIQDWNGDNSLNLM